MKKLSLILTLCFTLTSCASVGTKPDSNSSLTASNQLSTASDSVTSENTTNEPKEDIILTMAVFTSDEGMIDDFIAPFNEADNGYKIEIRNYYDFDAIGEYGLTREEGVAMDFRLLQDIMNTDDIDIISTSSFSSSAKFEILKNKGAFADLYPFMENDTEVNKNTLNNKILSFHEVDGKLYSIPPRYIVSRTIMGEKKYVGDKENWTIDEFIEHWNAMPEGATFNGNINSEYVYYAVLRNNLEAFIDYDNATVNFDCEEFRTMLEFCNQFPSSNGNKGEYYYDRPKFVYVCDIDGFMCSSLFDDEHTVVGYPTINGNGAYFTDSGSRYAISAKSSPEKQQGAWEFIRSLLTVEGLMTDYIARYDYINPETGEQSYTYSSDYGFPINNEAFEMQMNDMIEGKYSYMYEPSEGDIAEGFEAHMANIADPEKCQRLVEYLNNIDRWETRMDDALWLILEEEIMAYFSGENSLDECVSLIQNRASIWISEQC